MQGNRVCVCIGCDEYESPKIADLKGCIKDAVRIFGLLTDQNIGQNSMKGSHLLKNPTYNEIRSVFGELATVSNLDTLTIFFAGHGTIRDGSFFLTPRDTIPDRLSMTSFPIANLLMFVKEIRPRQVNILIDACESAGVVHNLKTIIDSEVVGPHSSMGVSVLVSSASDRNAGENNEGGLITSLVVDVITGHILSNSREPFLSLTDVARLVWNSGNAALSQQPSTWTLNIFGQNAFCKNPTGFNSEKAKFEYKIKGYDVTELAGMSQMSKILRSSELI